MGAKRSRGRRMAGYALPAPRSRAGSGSARYRAAVLRAADHRQNRRHRADRNHPADVEEAVGLSHQDHRRLREQREGAGGEEDAQLGRSEAPRREPEHAARVGGEVDLGRDQEIGHEQSQRDEGAHVAGHAEAPEEGARPDQIDDVVHVVAVARPLLIPHPGQGAVEAVAEPVDGEADDDEQQPGRVQARHPESQPRAEHRREGEGGQLVGRDPPRHAPREPEEDAPLAGGQKAAVLADMGSNVGFGHRHTPFIGECDIRAPSGSRRRGSKPVIPAMVRKGGLEPPWD